MFRCAVVLGAFAATLPWGALAADPVDLAACHRLADANARLVCYDQMALADQLGAGLAGKAAPSGTPVLPEIIASYDGSGAQRTRPFVASGPWVLEYRVARAGGVFYVSVEDAKTGSPVEQFSLGAEGTSAASYMPRPGSYTLKINATGTWHIDIKPD